LTLYNNNILNIVKLGDVWYVLQFYSRRYIQFGFVVKGKLHANRQTDIHTHPHARTHIERRVKERLRERERERGWERAIPPTSFEFVTHIHTNRPHHYPAVGAALDRGKYIRFVYTILICGTWDRSTYNLLHQWTTALLYKIYIYYVDTYLI
jgi:hypothetical protein